jgi:hypothetical protein
MNPNLPSLWTALRAMVARMHKVLGSAAALADRAWIGPKEQKEIRAWIAPLIAMARKIVLLEALVLARQPLPLRKPAQRALNASARASERKRGLRLWPKQKRARARVRQLGPPVLVREIWAERARAAKARLLNKVRFMRAPPAVQLARRIEAITRLIEKPRAAIHRLARKLCAQPKLAIALGAKRMPRTRLYCCEEYNAIGGLAFDGGVAFAYPNTS